MPRQGRAAVSIAKPARHWVTLVALLAFFLQSLLVQTHIHAMASLAPQGVHVAAPSSDNPLKSQDNSEQASCRLCQEIVHAGVFVTPVATVQAVALTISAALMPKSSVPAAALPAAFAWNSRAPPRR